MLVIGEKINASNRSVGEAISRRDAEFVAGLAQAQAAAGADFIDLNAGVGHNGRKEEIAAMKWLVETVEQATDKPLAIDSDSTEVIMAALASYHGDQVIINSVSAEPNRLKSIGSLAAEHGAWLVALAMGESGIPTTAEERLAACELIMTRLEKLGIKSEQVLFDPLVLPIAVDNTQGLITLKTIEQIKARFPGARTVAGLSNISYGLPERKLVNRSFLLMAAYAGLDAVISDPLDPKAMGLVKVADMLTGEDPLCRRYVRAHRQGKIAD
ncbi:dihydropteroate synthase [Chloroflexota bacterium]